MRAAHTVGDPQCFESLMFIDAHTPVEPPPPTGPVSEHNSGPKLGISAAQFDVHARVHGDGTSCPVCQMRVIAASGPLPLLEIAVATMRRNVANRAT